VRYTFLLAALTAVLVLPASSGSVPGKPWLWQCTQIHNAEAQYHCYVRLLRLDIETSRDPASELPRIDRRVAAAGGPVEAGCHVLMHEVGREFARDRHVTLATLQRYVPRSNNPNCSAGFGMGLVMYLGPQIIRSGGKSAVRSCASLPTRYREYTCVHGLGHALLRAYHGDIGQAVRACRNLPRNFAPDCAQGVFHDYWISLRGADGTTAPRRTMSPRTLCDGRLHTSGRAGTGTSWSSRLSSPCAMQRICAVPAAGCVPFNATAASARLRSRSPRIRSTRCGSAQNCGRRTRKPACVVFPTRRSPGVPRSSCA